MRRLSNSAMLLIIAGLNVAAASGARASPMQLTLDINGDTQTFTETSPNQILLPTTTFAGGVTVVGKSATSVVGSVNSLAVSGLNVQNTGTATATITGVVSGMNFAGPANFIAVSGSGTWLQTPGSSITQQWYDDPTNALGASKISDTPGNLVDSFTSIASKGSTDSFSYSPGDAPLAVPNTGPFSLAETWTYTLNPGGTIQTQAQTAVTTTDIPEPGALLLMGASMIPLAGLRRRRRAR
jgi:hypothetical protein